MSYVDLTKNDIWSESDITNRGRAVIESQVSEARQNELRTIMLGHIAQMRQASQEELGEIMQVQALTEQAVLDNAASRAGVLLLAQVMELEAAIARLAIEPLPDDEVDTSERQLAGLIVAAAQMLPEVMDLYALRNPAPVIEVVEVAL